MSELKVSITILVSYVIIVLGIANIDQFQESVIDFTPVFFILIAIVVFSELIITGGLIRAGVRLSYYVTISFWLLLYVLLWALNIDKDKAIEVHLIQMLLVMFAAVLSHDVGKRVSQIDTALDGLSSSAYPNRARDIQSSRDLISAEITRSRRYHHPLSILAMRLEKPKGKQSWKELDSLAVDMIERFAIAKVSQILSDLARSTDMVFLNKSGQFVILCPETNLSSTSILAERIQAAVDEELKANINWGSAAFPDEALTFDDLLEVAQKRIKDE